MLRTARRVSGLALCAALLSCAAQQSRIHPYVAPTVESNGRGALVYLEVTDQRPADNPQPEFVPTLQESISRALWRIGFRPTADPATPRSLRVGIRDVDYEPLLDRTRRLRLRAALDAQAGYHEEVYEQLYQSEAVVLLPTAPSPTFAREQLDLIVWDTLQKMFADESLFALLARE